MVLLKNEKYAGNALLQKKYVTDHITKKEVLNRGQMPRYYAVGTHPAIVDPETFRLVQQRIQENREKNNIAVKTPAKYPFTKKIECANCGKSYRRVVYQGTPKWQCASYLREGREACPAKQIPEDVLLSLASKALGLKSFDADALHKHVLKIRVIAPNLVRFVFVDGQVRDLTWQDRSRRNSWTEEMRQTARERSIQKRTQRL